jgi:predicted nuclease of restriction endonuclease-like RecB superfamily
LLTLPLLRVRTRKGAIFPRFCTRDEEIELARKLIQEFEQVWKNKEKKAVLEARVAAIEESEVGSDYKLVRGFYVLLERRCSFKSNNNDIDNDGITTPSNTSVTIPSIEPLLIRKAIFEESSKRGFALTELERREIADYVASELHLSSADAVLKAMWSDSEINLILDYFHAIDPRALVGWYNLSLMQTLLFNCTKLDFYISGGLNWKRVLRSVKRLGLMYHLQQPQQQQQEQKQIICSLEGPLSLFNLTDRYGTSLAKLLPSIIFSSEMEEVSSSSGDWHLDAWILRKTMDGRKMYEFKISKSEIPELLTDPFLYFPPSISIVEKQAARSLPYPYNYFDSAVEEKFANRFEQAETGWRMIREPDPLVLSDGRAFIPDFLFEKFEMKVYLEIVGFWTKDYLEKKLQKLADIFVSPDDKSKNNSSYNNNNKNRNAELLFVAVNEEFACSKPSFSSIVPRKQLIFYKNDAVPVKPIIDFLKSLDKEMIERKINDPNLRIELDSNSNNAPVISISEVAKKYGLPTEVVRRILLRDNNEKYIETGMYLILKSKAHILESLLVGTNSFVDACSILSSEAIPESCHAELLVNLGYDVIWQSIDASTAIISKRKG